MFAKPTAEHTFFAPMIGQWTMEHRCDMGNGEPQVTATGRVAIRSLCGMWYLIECSGDGTGENPEPWSSLFTLGYDPAKKAFVGTFVGSMMAQLWVYEGQLDAAGKCVSLGCEGPRFDGNGRALYRDSFEIVSPDHWILRSEIQEVDGTWRQFMEGHHHRIEST
jgi:hypothetical protein